MANKTYIVTFRLKELAASHYWHSTQVDAPSIGRAVDLGWKEVKTRPHIKGKRLSKADITVEQISTISNEN
jgi:hypothetical protein